MARVAAFCLILSAAPFQAAFAGRALKGANGVCDTPECHQSTGQANYNAAWQKQYADVQAAPGPIPTGFFSGSMTEAQLQCVTNCQNAQQQAQTDNQAFDWKTCQDNCLGN